MPPFTGASRLILPASTARITSIHVNVFEIEPIRNSVVLGSTLRAGANDAESVALLEHDAAVLHDGDRRARDVLVVQRELHGRVDERLELCRRDRLLGREPRPCVLNSGRRRGGLGSRRELAGRLSVRGAERHDRQNDEADSRGANAALRVRESGAKRRGRVRARARAHQYPSFTTPVFIPSTVPAVSHSSDARKSTR